MKLSNKTYDILKDIALIYLGAIGLFYQTIADIWSLPYGTQFVATCTALSVLLGSILKISNHNYKKGNGDE